MKEMRQARDRIELLDRPFQTDLDEREFLRLVKAFEEIIRLRLNTLEPGTKALIDKLLLEASEQEDAVLREVATA